MARPRKGEDRFEEVNEKYKKTMLEKYGGPEGYHRHMQEVGRKGGRVCGMKGFALSHERAVLAGAKGGRISRRKPIVQTRLREEKQKIIQLLNSGCSKKEIADSLGFRYTTLIAWINKNVKTETLYDEMEEKND